jgi:hypothetical protein
MKWTSLRNLRYRGTAVFVEHKERYYLITAEHVVHDLVGAKHELEFRLDRFKKWRGTEEEYESSGTKERDEDGAKHVIYDLILRVPSFDSQESTSSGLPPQVLMSVGAGTYPDTTDYSFHPELDLAIISLNARKGFRPFLDELMDEGYRPISLDQDVDERPQTEGTQVYAVGFPNDIAVIEQRNVNTTLQSKCISLPVYSFGYIAMLHPRLSNFWCDISIYPGSSGCPIVEKANDKLILKQANDVWPRGSPSRAC